MTFLVKMMFRRLNKFDGFIFGEGGVYTVVGGGGRGGFIFEMIIGLNI